MKPPMCSVTIHKLGMKFGIEHDIFHPSLQRRSFENKNSKIISAACIDEHHRGFENGPKI